MSQRSSVADRDMAFALLILELGYGDDPRLPIDSVPVTEIAKRESRFNAGKSDRSLTRAEARRIVDCYMAARELHKR